MRKLLALAVLVFAMAAGCAMYVPLTVTDNPIGSKVGECSFKDGGALKAAQNAGITRIATVDYRVVSFFGIPISRMYIVSGE